MKKLFKKSGILFFSLSLFVSLIVSVTAAPPDSVMVNVPFSICNVPGRRGEVIQVEIEPSLIRDNQIEYRGGECTIKDWSSILVENFLVGRLSSSIMRVEFRSNPPLSFEFRSVVHEGINVYILDSGRQAIIVCKSISDLNPISLRASAVTLSDMVGANLVLKMFKK